MLNIQYHFRVMLRVKHFFFFKIHRSNCEWAEKRSVIDMRYYIVYGTLDLENIKAGIRLQVSQSLKVEIDSVRFPAH